MVRRSSGDCLVTYEEHEVKCVLKHDKIMPSANLSRKVIANEFSVLLRYVPSQSHSTIMQLFPYQLSHCQSESYITFGSQSSENGHNIVPCKIETSTI